MLDSLRMLMGTPKNTGVQNSKYFNNTLFILCFHCVRRWTHYSTASVRHSRPPMNRWKQEPDPRFAKWFQWFQPWKLLKTVGHSGTQWDTEVSLNESSCSFFFSACIHLAQSALQLLKTAPLHIPNTHRSLHRTSLAWDALECNQFLWQMQRKFPRTQGIFSLVAWWACHRDDQL